MLFRSFKAKHTKPKQVKNAIKPTDDVKAIQDGIVKYNAMSTISMMKLGSINTIRNIRPETFMLFFDLPLMNFSKSFVMKRNHNSHYYYLSSLPFGIQSVWKCCNHHHIPSNRVPSNPISSVHFHKYRIK